MYPRMLMTFNENLKPLPVLVRVGQAVDTIGQVNILLKNNNGHKSLGW